MERRRTAKRVRIAEPVIIAWERGEFVGEARDVSLRGIFVALPHAGNVAGASLVVRIPPTYPRAAVELAGVVRWSNGRGMGVELARVGAPEAAALETLIASAKRI